MCSTGQDFMYIDFSETGGKFALYNYTIQLKGSEPEWSNPPI